MDWVLKSIITDEFRNNVYDENWSRNPDEYNKQGMLMAFTIGSSDPMVLERSEEEQYCRYPKRELFIWGPMNYIGVFTRDTMMHPDVFSPWYIAPGVVTWIETGVPEIAVKDDIGRCQQRRD